MRKLSFAWPALLVAVVCTLAALHDHFGHSPKRGGVWDGGEWHALKYEQPKLNRGRSFPVMRYLLGARNGSGTYSLPAGNPVVTNTTISSTWANTTLSDIGTELTNSLDRNGRGPMLAPLALQNGTAAAPSETFASDTTTGWYRFGANIWGFSASGVSTGITLSATGIVVSQISAGFGALAVFSGAANPAIYASSTNVNQPAAQLLGCATGGGCTAAALLVSAGAGTSPAISAQGGGTGIGGIFTNGTAATGGTRQIALQLANGDLSFSGTANPTGTTSLINQLTPASFIKAYGLISCIGGSSTTCNIVQSLNVSAVTALNGQGDCINAGSKPIRVTLAGAMAAKGYPVIVTTAGDGSGASPAMMYANSNATNASTTQFDICGNSAVAGGAYSFFGSGGGGSFIVLGNQ